MTAVRKNAPPASLQWLSLYEAARVLGMSRLKLLTLTLRGEFEHAFVGKQPVISRTSVEKYKGTSAA